MFSFKINKKASSTSTVQVSKGYLQKPSGRSAFNDDEEREEEPDFIDGLDGTTILSKKQKKSEKKELIIPLITKNEWRIDKKEENIEKEREGADTKKALAPAPPPNPDSSNGCVKEDSLKQQAIKELLEGVSSEGPSSKNNDRAIPLLFQNKVPDGYEEDDNMDVSLRPDESTLDDYDRIPIDEFGLAMLRGMGWKQEEGIGLKNKKVVDMAIPKLRPKGMGLGAEAPHANKDVAPRNAANNGENEKEDLTLRIGGHVIVNKGSKKGYYGQIESFDEDNNRVILRLAITGKMETISKFYIDAVTSKEYKKNSKVINSEKYEEYHSRQEVERNDEKPPSYRIEGERRRSRSRSEGSDEDYKHNNSKSRSRHREHDSDEDKYERKSKSKRSGNPYDDRERTEDKRRKEHKDRGDRDRSRSHYDKEYDDRDRSYKSDDYKTSRRNEKESSSSRNHNDHRRSHSSKSYRK